MALPTAVTSSLISIVPLWLGSPARQALTGKLPSAMFTIVISSLMVTSPLPSQSPTQGIPAVTVAVAVAVVPGGVAVWVAVAVLVPLGNVGVRVPVAVGVPVRLG